MQRGASMVKWTTLAPCIGSSESDSNYTLTLNFMKEKLIDIQKYVLIYQAKQFMMTKTIPRKVHIF